jgi:hypothetical protein
MKLNDNTTITFKPGTTEQLATFIEVRPAGGDIAVGTWLSTDQTKILVKELKAAAPPPKKK